MTFFDGDPEDIGERLVSSGDARANNSGLVDSQKGSTIFGSSKTLQGKSLVPKRGGVQHENESEEDIDDDDVDVDAVEDNSDEEKHQDRDLIAVFGEEMFDSFGREIRQDLVARKGWHNPCPRSAPRD